MDRVIVVVPTYDEAAGIGALLERVRREMPDADVLVVDDASPDGTAGIVRSQADFGDRIRLLERPGGKQGLGAAYRAGFGWALEHGYGVVVQMDADLSHPPDRIAALVAALDRADVAIGSRYVRGGATRNWGIGRRLVSWAGNQYVRLVLNLGIADATAGFRAYRRGALEAIGVLDSASNGYAFQIENSWKARRRDLVIVEVPITFTDRAVGMSKMTGAIAAEAVGRVLRWRLGELRDRLRSSPRADM